MMYIITLLKSKNKAWLEKKVLDTWHIMRYVQWWCQPLDQGRNSNLPFPPNAFLWCVMVDGLPLVMEHEK